MASTDQSESILSEKDLAQIEKSNPSGLTSAQIINIFQSSGARLSEATFRKYVQLGLLPRSKRVGVKGKHRGSHGIYPCATVRRINSIKRLMSQSYTIEEIQRSFSAVKEQIGELELMLEDLFMGLEREIAQPQFDRSRRRILDRDIDLAKKTANDLVRCLHQIETHVVLSEKSKKVANGGMLTNLRRTKS